MVLFLSFFNVSRKILKCSFYLYINGTVYLTRAAPKVTPPILLCWPTMSEADVSCMAVDAEHYNQYSITFCCHAIDNSRGAVSQNGI